MKSGFIDSIRAKWRNVLSFLTKCHKIQGMFVVTDDGEVKAYICNQSLFKDGGSEDSLHSRSKLEGQA